MADKAVEDSGTFIRISRWEYGSELLVEWSEDRGKSWKVVDGKIYWSNSWDRTPSGGHVLLHLPSFRCTTRTGDDSAIQDFPPRPENLLRGRVHDVDGKDIRSPANNWCGVGMVRGRKRENWCG